MLVDRATRTEFLRYVYANGGANEAARQAYISTWREAALDSLRDGGVISSASSNSNSTGFSVPSGWSPQQVMELAAWARSYVSEADVDDALASVPAKVVRFSADFSGVRV